MYLKSPQQKCCLHQASFVSRKSLQIAIECNEMFVVQVEEVDNRYSMRIQGLMSDNTDLRQVRNQLRIQFLRITYWQVCFRASILFGLKKKHCMHVQLLKLRAIRSFCKQTIQYYKFIQRACALYCRSLLDEASSSLAEITFQATCTSMYKWNIYLWRLISNVKLITMNSQSK